MNQIVSITQNKDFKRAYYQGKYKAHPILVTYLVRNRVGVHRVGVVTSKKVGKAHERNRAKRIIIAAYRENMDVFAQMFAERNPSFSYDIVLMARPGITEKTSTSLIPIMRGQVQALLRQLLSPKKTTPSGRNPQKNSSKAGTTRTTSQNKRSSPRR